MSTYNESCSIQHLRPNHDSFEIQGKPALVLCHMQVGLVGKQAFIPNWGPKAAACILKSGMIGKCRELADLFREKKLPVIFVQTMGKPFGVTPAYGDLFREINLAWPENKQYDEFEPFTAHGLEVIPEMGRMKSDYVLRNWQVHSFGQSGLEIILRNNGCDTVVWGGFAQNSAIYASCLVASDYGINNIVPVDASCICVPPSTPLFQDGLDSVVAEAIVKVLMPAVSQCTDTLTVTKKIRRSF